MSSVSNKTLNMNDDLSKYSSLRVDTTSSFLISSDAIRSTGTPRAVDLTHLSKGTNLSQLLSSQTHAPPIKEKPLLSSSVSVLTSGPEREQTTVSLGTVINTGAVAAKAANVADETLQPDTVGGTEGVKKGSHKLIWSVLIAMLIIFSIIILLCLL